MSRNTNAAPKCKWFDQSNFMPDGCKRHRLYVNGVETPYFIDASDRVSHRTQGDKFGLFGAGMHPKGIALALGSSQTIAILKHRAEQRALDGFQQTRLAA